MQEPAAVNDPQNISIDCRAGELKADGSDRGGGIVADAGQRTDGIIVRWENAAVLPADLNSCQLKISGPRIVAKSFPKLIELFFRVFRQILDGGKLTEKAEVIPFDGLHAGLLAHDLAQPDMIWLAVRTPGEGTLAVLIPVEQKPGDLMVQRQIDQTFRFTLAFPGQKRKGYSSKVPGTLDRKRRTVVKYDHQ